jgi:hypothetical protein
MIKNLDLMNAADRERINFKLRCLEVAALMLGTHPEDKEINQIEECYLPYRDLAAAIETQVTSEWVPDDDF